MKKKDKQEIQSSEIPVKSIVSGEPLFLFF